MYKLKAIILVWIACWACTMGYAQKFFPFSQYIETGNKTVFCTFRDADGVWWSGTSQGLFSMAQLMGQNKHVYSRHSELENVIVQIQQDNLKRLWLKTLSNQYMIYDPRNNELISDVETYLQKMGIKVWYDFRVFIDTNGKVWFYKDNMLYSYDFRQKTFQQLVFPIWVGRIIGIAFHKEQMIAVAEKAVFGVKGICPSDSKLKKRLSGKLHFELLTRTPVDFQYDMSLVNLSDKGDVWVYADRKLFAYFSASKSWVELNEEAQYIQALLRLPNGQLYVATSSKGILVYDENGRLVKRLGQSMPFENGLISNHIQCLCYDARSHAISVGYGKHGLSFFLADAYELDEHPVQWSSNKYHLEDVISLSPADRNSVWLGTEDNGIYRVKTDGTHQILENKFPKMTATAVLQDSYGKIWIGAFCGGLLCSDGRHFLPGESPYKIIEINAHRFIILLNGKGMMVFDPQTGKTKPIPTENPWVMDATLMGDYLYAATPLFLYKVNVKTFTTTKIPVSVFKHSSFNNGNRTLLADSRGWIWLVSHKGRSAVDIYDTKQNRAFQVTQLKDYDISSLREDGHGNVWCATDKGLVVVKVHEKTSNHQSASASFPSFELYCYVTKSTSMFNYRAMMNVDANHLLIGTTRGYLLVDAQRLERLSSKKEQMRQVVISSLRINGNYVSPGEMVDGRILVQADLPYLKQLHLKSSENNIILECLPKEIYSNELNSYEYKLEGTDVDWMPIDNHIISLSNLNPGNYKLLVRGQDVNHSQYQTYTLLEIEIDPPLWKSVWAYLLYLVFILIAAYATYRYLRHRQEIKRKVQELRFEAEQEKRLNEMKLKFFTNISHDLRTPLTLIITPVEEMMNTVKDKGLLHVLGIVHNNAKLLYRLVNQILDFRKLENDASRLNLSYGDIVVFLKNILQEYDLMAKKQGLSLAFDTDVEKLDMLFDKEKVEHVANNMLSNAIKYTPNGGQIGLRLFREDKQLRLDFWDTGIGVSDEDKVHVFDRFYMTNRKNSEFASSGIGLNIVKEFVDLWQGEVEVLDNHPKGTVFSITIPITSMPHDVVAGQKAQQGGDASKLPIVRSESTVLLVEDNVELLDYLSQMLSCEYAVCQATDGQQALDILRATDVDVVVSDVMMDGMDGFTLCKRMKSDVNISHIPIILLTAKALSQDEVEGLSLGASDYITKPFHMDVLRLRIRAVLEKVESFRKQIREENEISPSEVTVTTLDEQLLSDIIRLVEENMGNADFNVETLCEKLCMHRSNLYKKVQFISGRSPAQFIRMMRLKRSKQLMSRGNVLISQVAYEVGFNDPKKFARYFKEEFGMLPSEYMKQQENARMAE